MTTGFRKHWLFQKQCTHTVEAERFQSYVVIQSFYFQREQRIRFSHSNQLAKKKNYHGQGCEQTINIFLISEEGL